MKIRDWTFADYYTKLERVIDICIKKYDGLKSEKDDLKQEAYILLFENIDKINEVDNYEAFFTQVLKNKYYGILVDEHKQGLHSTISLNYKKEDDDCDLLDFVDNAKEFIYGFSDEWYETYLKKRRQYDREYKKRPEVRAKFYEYRKEYEKRPYVKKRISDKKKQYYVKNRTNILEKQKEYHQRHEIKEKRKEYLKKYEERNRKKLREYQKEYRSRPEVKERAREYQKKYREKKKQEKLMNDKK